MCFYGLSPEDEDLCVQYECGCCTSLIQETEGHHCICACVWFLEKKEKKVWCKQQHFHNLNLYIDVHVMPSGLKHSGNIQH